MSETVDEIAEALKEDPVHVDPLFGNGRTEEVREALTDIVDDLGFPAYVVLVPRPEGLSANDPDRELASLLHERIGGDGMFYVHTGATSYSSALAGFGDVPDEFLLQQVHREHAPDGGAVTGLTPAGIAARSLEALSTRGDMSRQEFDSYAEQAVWREPPEWDVDYEVPGEGTYAAFTTMAFVVVAGCAWLVLRNLVRWRETAPPTAVAPARRTARPAVREQDHPLAGPAEVRVRVERELGALAARLASTASRPRPAETRELVDGSYDTARGVLERTGTAARDLDDLVGALVLVRVADRALGSARRRATPYRPCFFDPRHGEGVSERTVPVGDRTLTVPACKRCGRSGDAELEPMRLPTSLLGRDRPWFEHDTVWARTGYGAFVDDLWHHVAAEQREA
jgi:hypothetical protein